MNEKKLNDIELENVAGGQAVLPLLSKEPEELPEEMLVGVNRFILCSSCGKTLAVPASGHGTFTCTCGAVNHY